TDIHGDFLGEIAVRHGGCDLGDVTHLIRQVVRHEIHIIGEVLPGSGHPFHLRLTAQFSFFTDFSGEAPYLRSKRGELFHHRIDGVLQSQDFALNVDCDLFRKVSTGDGGGHFGDVADLSGQVRRHEVDVIGKVLPSSGDAFYLRLATELSFRTYFTHHASDVGCEGLGLVHHGVDRVFQLQDFAFHVDGDLLGKITARDSRSHLGDIAHLIGQVVCHGVHVIGEVLPGSGDAFYLCLAAELAFGT